MLREFRFYRMQIKLHLLSGLEYKGWWMMVLQVLTVCITDPIAIIFMFMRFGGIGVWTFERIILIYAIAVTSYGLAESFFRGFDYFPWHMLRSGNFDRLLLRPKSLFSQVASSFFHIHRMARPVAGTCVIIWALVSMNISISFYNMTMLFTALAGGVITYAGVYVMSSGIAFFTVKALDWIYIFTNASYQITRIPPEYMPGFLKKPFTFFMPMLVISYYPASAICGWGDASWLGWLALPAGTAFLGFSLILWQIGVKHYKSTGS